MIAFVSAAMALTLLSCTPSSTVERNATKRLPGNINSDLEHMRGVWGKSTSCCRPGFRVVAGGSIRYVEYTWEAAHQETESLLKELPQHGIMVVEEVNSEPEGLSMGHLVFDEEAEASEDCAGPYELRWRVTVRLDVPIYRPTRSARRGTAHYEVTEKCATTDLLIPTLATLRRKAMLQFAGDWRATNRFYFKKWGIE